jgi:hypothetical protein
MTPSANVVFALTLFAAVTALAMWLARRHQRTMYRRNMTKIVKDTLSSAPAETQESQVAGEPDTSISARIAS